MKTEKVELMDYPKIEILILYVDWIKYHTIRTVVIPLIGDKILISDGSTRADIIVDESFIAAFSIKGLEYLNMLYVRKEVAQAVPRYADSKITLIF